MAGVSLVTRPVWAIGATPLGWGGRDNQSGPSIAQPGCPFETRRAAQEPRWPADPSAAIPVRRATRPGRCGARALLLLNGHGGAAPEFALGYTHVLLRRVPHLSTEHTPRRLSSRQPSLQPGVPPRGPGMTRRWRDPHTPPDRSGGTGEQRAEEQVEGHGGLLIW